MKKRILSLLLCLVLCLSLMPTVAFAVTANVQLSEAGVLTWDAFGDTGVYSIDVSRYPDGSGTVVNISNIYDREYSLKARCDELKLEPNVYYVTVYTTSGGNSINSERVGYHHVSSLPRLAEPQNLRWEGTVACWDAVSNATGYSVTLKHEAGSNQYTRTPTGTSYDFGTDAHDGRWFTVVATADGYRSSNTAESPKYGTPGSIDETISGNGGDEWNIQMSPTGVLSWNAVGSTGVYRIDVSRYQNGSGLVTDISGINTCNYDFKARCDEVKLESGFYYIAIYTTNGGNSINSKTVNYYYVSPYPRLAEPQNLRWDGTLARWDAVPNATGYSVTLITAAGYNQYTKTPTGTAYDFGTGASDGRWFTVVATADGYRNSNTAESPKCEISVNYTVTFDANGGTGSMASEILTADNNGFVTTYTFPACGFAAPAGKVFDKWEATYTSGFDAGYSWNPDPGDIPYLSGSIVVKAIWKDTYSVTFNMNGHGVAPAAQTVAKGGKATKPADPTAEGWTFGGWYKNVGCTDPWDFNTDTVMANTPLYAKWLGIVAAPVTVSGSLAIGDTLNSVFSVAGGTNATLHSVSWHHNGKHLASPGTAEMGKYQAVIILKAANGYGFRSTTTATIFGKTVAPYAVSDDGQYAYYLSDTVTLTCDHSGDTSEYVKTDPDRHWKVCSVCGATYGAEGHSYGDGVTSGSTTTYTCTDCGYKKTVTSDNERIDWVIINTPPLAVGGTLPDISPLSTYNAAKMTLSSYQWNDGTSDVAVGATVESGKTYTLTLNCTAKEGYYFDSDNKPGVKVGFASASDTNKTVIGNSLTATLSFTPVASATATVALPTMTVGKTMEAVLNEINASTISAAFYGKEVEITVGSTTYSYRNNKYTTGWAANGGSPDYDTFKAQTVQPGATYRFKINLNNEAMGSYVQEKDITVTNKSAADSVVVTTNQTGVMAIAIYSTEGDGKTISTADLTVTAPVTGETPATSATGGSHYSVGTPAWSGTPTEFAADTAYTVTLTLTPDSGYTFDANTIATVNGFPASASKNGDNLVVTYTFPQTGKIPQTISFAKNTVNIAFGNTVTQTVTAKTTVTYSVEEGGDIVSVNSSTGVVTPSKIGTAVIKATAIEAGNYLAAEATYVVNVAKSPAPAAPSCTFSFDGEDAGKLMGATTTMECSLNYGGQWTDCTDDMALNTENITADDDICVRVKGTETALPGAVQIIDIAKADTPSGIGMTDCTTEANDDGTLTGVTTAMEYQKSGASGWTSISGTTVTGLTNGVYYVRVKASGTVQVSEAYPVTIVAYNKYTVTFNANGGSVTPTSAATGAGGKLASLPTPTRYGYTFDGWYTEAMGGDKVTIEKVYTADTTIYARWTKDKPSFDPTLLFLLDDEPVARMSFRDVQRGAYYYDAVKWAVKSGITEGKTAYIFDPNGPVTRAQAVTFLWRAAGCPKVNYFMKFTDLKPGAYYTEAVRWAVAMGITKGVDETHFAPDATCTRGHIVSFLYRYAKASAIKTANPFTDVAADAYYYDAVLWAVANGITGGTTATTFAPTDICNRAQVVTFLYRYMAK